MAFWLLIAVAALLLLLLLVALSDIRVRIRYSRSGHQDQMAVIVKALYGAYRYRMIVPAIMIRGFNLYYEKKASEKIAGKRDMSMPKWRKGKGFIRKWRMFNPWLRHTLKKVECTRFRLDFRVGTGDAPTTAIISGLLWSVYGCAVGLTSQLVKLNAKPYGGVEPVYHSEEFTLVWEADFRIRIWEFTMSVLNIGSGSFRLRKSWRYWRRWLRGPQSA